MTSKTQKTNVAWSGGKDSTAMLLRMIELNYPIDKIMFANTGVEYPEMYQYVNKIKRIIKLPITIIHPKTSFWHWFYGKWTSGRNEGEMRGFPKITTHGYCCRELKYNPQRKIMNPEYPTALGIAYDERFRESKQENLVYPLIEWKWTENMCNQYLRSKKLENPLYKHMNRTGCWLCPKQSLSSLRFLFEQHPKMWNHLKKMEKESPGGFHHQRKLIDLENKWKYQTKLECYI